jgi:hypothetical protein
MQLWIDNTGLQSAGLCLEGRARPAHDYDVRGLLQLATLLVYGNKISLNGFEDKVVADRTEEMVDRLRGLGIAKNILSISPITEVEYALACRTAADSVGPDLASNYNPDDFRLVGGEPPDLPRGVAKRQVNYVALAHERKGSAKLHAVEKAALRDKAIGAIEYMMACSPPLRKAVTRILKTNPNFEDTRSYDLNVLLRYHLNDALAEQSFAKYAPAIGRAELVARRNQYILTSIGGLLDKTATELRSKLSSEPLGTPSMVVALLHRSKAEPQGVLTAALEFREHSKALRNTLEKLATKYLDDTPEARFEIQAEINELGAQLRRDVGLDKRATLRGAVDVKWALGTVPIPFISSKEIVKWVRELKKKKQTAVLTELIKASAYSDAPSDLYKKLRKQSIEANS